MSKATVFLLAVLLGICSGAPFNDDKIIGGQVAPDGAYPHMASIRSGAGKSFSCGAGIITQRTLITAAHCIVGTSAANTFIVVGTNKVDTSGVTYNVQRLIPHPNYNSGQLKNDIGLVIVDSNIIYGEKIQPIELDYNYVAGNQAITLNGWGNTNHPNGQTPVDLQFIVLASLTNPDCRAKMPTGSFLHDENLCTLNKRGEGICFGDSGSPLTLGGKLIAVVSWSYPCAIDLPDGHVRVSSYQQWINDNTVQ